MGFIEIDGEIVHTSCIGKKEEFKQGELVSISNPVCGTEKQFHQARKKPKNNDWQKRIKSLTKLFIK